MTDMGRVAAARPTDIPAKGWWDVLVRSWRDGTSDNISLIAAGVAFYGFLAFVPLLAALVLTYGLVADPATVIHHFRALTEVMPAEAARLIGEQLLAVTQAATGRKGFGLLLALGVALYGAMKGASAIVTALNIAYDVEESRSFVRQTLVAAAITLGALVTLILAIIAVSVFAFVRDLMPFSSPFAYVVLKAAFALVSAAAMSGVLALTYRYAPDRPTAKWRWLTPGSMLATAFWLIATILFGVYVSNFGDYNATYGSLGAVVVFLTWLYLSAYILLMGAELNSELEAETACETKTA